MSIESRVFQSLDLGKWEIGEGLVPDADGAEFLRTFDLAPSICPRVMISAL